MKTFKDAIAAGVENLGGSVRQETAVVIDLATQAGLMVSRVGQGLLVVFGFR